MSNSNLYSYELKRNTAFRTLINFSRKANKWKFAYMLSSRCSVTWYPTQVLQLVAFHGSTLCCHPQLTRKYARLLVASFSHHGLWNAIFMGNFTIIVDCLSFDNNFQLEVKVIQLMACAWHICIQTRNWSVTLTIYDENISVSQQSLKSVGWWLIEWNRIIEYLLFNFVNRSMFPKQDGWNIKVYIFCFSLQVWNFSLGF